MCSLKDFLMIWRGARAVEGARLESVCTVLPYRGFESLSLRHFRYGEFQRDENPRGSIKRQERRFRLFAARRGRAKDGEDQSLSLRHFRYGEFQRDENPRGSIKRQERHFRLFAARRGRAKDGEDQSLSLRFILNDFVEMSFAFNRSCASQLLSIELANIVFCN